MAHYDLNPIPDQWPSRRLTLGLLVRRIIHFALDCIDAFIRPRARHKLWILDRVKTCGGCIEREILIDHYSRYLLKKLRHWFAKQLSKQSQEVLAGVGS